MHRISPHWELRFDDEWNYDHITVDDYMGSHLIKDAVAKFDKAQDVRAEQRCSVSQSLTVAPVQDWLAFTQNHLPVNFGYYYDNGAPTYKLINGPCGPEIKIKAAQVIKPIVNVAYEPDTNNIWNDPKDEEYKLN